LEHLDDFGFQVIEIGVVQLKLALEGAIRYPTPALEYVEGAVEDLFEGHHHLASCTTVLGPLTLALSRRERG
jgi:hypothetical protein